MPVYVQGVLRNDLEAVLGIFSDTVVYRVVRPPDLQGTDFDVNAFLDQMRSEVLRSDHAASWSRPGLGSVTASEMWLSCRDAGWPTRFSVDRTLVYRPAGTTQLQSSAIVSQIRPGAFAIAWCVHFVLWYAGFSVTSSGALFAMKVWRRNRGARLQRCAQCGYPVEPLLPRCSECGLRREARTLERATCTAASRGARSELVPRTDR